MIIGKNFAGVSVRHTVGRWSHFFFIKNCLENVIFAVFKRLSAFFCDHTLQNLFY